jgi:hypothetical protein
MNFHKYFIYAFYQVLSNPPPLKTLSSKQGQNDQIYGVEYIIDGFYQFAIPNRMIR